MAEIGHVTPAKPVWPEPDHSEYREIGERPQREGHHDKDHRRREGGTESEEPADHPSSPVEDGHIDEFA